MNPRSHTSPKDPRRLETAVVVGAALAAILSLAVVAVQVERQQSPPAYTGVPSRDPVILPRLEPQASVHLGVNG